MSSSTKPSLLSELRVSGPVWLASDIHLGSHNPRTCQAFYEFLACARHQTDTLILLGDIFEVWIGDDCARRPEPWLQQAIDALQKTAHALSLWVMGGNRDFLIGQDFAHSIGARFLSGPVVLEVQPNKHPTQPTSLLTPSAQTQRFLLAHGDEFCTADLGYQRLRHIVRQRWLQKVFLTLPLSIRQRIAHKMRNTSQNMVRHDRQSRYDVQDGALRGVLNANQLSSIIHGHTHQPGHYRITETRSTAQTARISNKNTVSNLERWVLPDWEHDHLESPANARGGWLEISGTGPTLRAFHAQDQNTK